MINILGSKSLDKIPAAGGGIYGIDCGYFYVNNLTINDSIASAGGAIYLDTTS